MKTWKHLDIENRKAISSCISHNYKLINISKILNYDPRGISREVKRNRIPIDFPNATSSNCPTLKRWPYVCTNCKNRYKECPFIKFKYDAKIAQRKADANLINSRKGIDINNDEFNKLDYIIKKGIDENKSIYQIKIENKDEINKSITTLYRYINNGILTTKRIDLPRAVKFKKRKHNKKYEYSENKKIDRTGHTYLDYLSYIHKNPRVNVWQLDFLGAIKTDSKNILSFILPEVHFTLLDIIKNPSSAKVVKFFDDLEEKIIKDFGLAEIVVCTDAGLSSKANRKFNDTNNRKFITTQSIKKLKDFLNEWALDLSSGWRLPNSDKTYNIENLRTDESLIEKFKDVTFYKERWIKEDNIEQRLIVTYSVKYQEYQKHIRNNQIERARKIIEKNPSKLGKAKQNDPKRFIDAILTTNDGEVANEVHYSINESAIEMEAKYDGLYAVCTNLEDNAEEIIKVNHRRWEIEESFRIMKSEFNARPVFHSNEESIKAHFLICFLALTVYRYLEKELDEKYTVGEIIDTLKNYTLRELQGYGYIPNYEPTKIIDALHEKFKIETNKEINDYKKIKKIINKSKE